MTKKILVVDDKAELRTLLKSYLIQEGFEWRLPATGARRCSWRGKKSRT